MADYRFGVSEPAVPSCFAIAPLDGLYASTRAVLLVRTTTPGLVVAEVAWVALPRLAAAFLCAAVGIARNMPVAMPAK
jgi:hypothetical protein